MRIMSIFISQQIVIPLNCLSTAKKLQQPPSFHKNKLNTNRKTKPPQKTNKTQHQKSVLNLKQHATVVQQKSHWSKKLNNTAIIIKHIRCNICTGKQNKFKQQKSKTIPYQYHHTSQLRMFTRTILQNISVYKAVSWVK